MCNVLLREQLFNRLDRNRETSSISWITSPPGAGKTTLVASYLEQRKLRCLWYRIDAGDHDLSSFFHFLGLAAARVAPRYRRPLPKLTPEYAGAAKVFARNFFRELTRRIRAPFALVFDDWHEIGPDAELHGVLCAGLDELAPGAHAILLSREPPPAPFARMRLNGRIEEIGWPQLRLDESESRCLARLIGSSRSTSDEAIDELNRRCGGWIAGLILMLGTATDTPGGSSASPAHSQALFDYFAEEVFARRSPDVRQFLMIMALLRAFTAEMAVTLTGLSNAPSILDDLVRTHHFTERHAERLGSYRFHPLFREFLLAQARAAWGPEETAALQARAAAVLEQHGRIEEALALYLSAQEMDAAAGTILGAAGELAAAGRYATLAEAIGKLPEAMVESDAWLRYWRGVSRTSSSLFDARSDFEAAFALSDDRNDAAGLYLAWTAIVQTYFAEYRDYRPVGRWIAVFQSLRRRFPKFPSPEVEAETLAAAIGALSQRYGDHRLLPELSTRLEQILGSVTPNRRMLLAVHPLMYYTVIGKHDRATRLLDALEADLRLLADDPVARLAWCNCAALFGWCTGQARNALRRVDEGLELVERHGLPVLRLMILFQGAYASCVLGDAERAERFLEPMRKAAGGRDDIHAAVYHQFAAMVAAHRGKLTEAGMHADIAVRLAESKGVTFGYFCNLYSCVVAACMAADENKAKVTLEKARRIGQRTGSRYIEFLCRLADCALRVSRGGDEAIRRALRETFTLSRELGGPSAPWWPHSMLARIYAAALHHDIERSHVEALIEKTEVSATNDVMHVDAWPWPVKIYTLGRFGLVVGRQPLKFTGKAQKKPLEMLKILVASGGRSVREDRIAASLWPDTDDSHAALAMTTTLHRLRKLLGKDAVQRQEGRLSINARVCWVDVWALERLTRGVERSCRRQEDPDVISAGIDELCGLYQGAFLQDHDEHPWLLARRERLHSKFLRTVMMGAEALAGARRRETAARCLERALEIDPLAEGVYRRLIQMHLDGERRAEALATYRKCRRMLARHFGVDPSPETEALRRRIET